MEHYHPITKYEDQTSDQNPDPVLESFLAALALTERLHRLLLDVIKEDLASYQKYNINPVQALLLYHIGPDQYSASDLRLRGYYQGSNVSYNLKKLVENDYIIYETDLSDRRSIRIRLTPKGSDMQDKIHRLYQKLFQEIIANQYWNENDCFKTKDNLTQLERLLRSQLIR